MATSLSALSSELRTYLLSKSAISSLVSTRVYPSWIPQSQTTRPAITIDQYDSLHEYETTQAAGWCNAKVQIDCWADTLLAAKQLAEAIRANLQAYSGTLCEVAILRRQFDQYESPKQADDEPIFRTCQQWEIIIKESVPTY